MFPMGGGKKKPLYVDDVFSTYLYTGNSASQRINNGINLGSTVTDDPYFNNVTLLLHMDGSNGGTVFTDNSSCPKVITANGANTVTSPKKLGTASGSFNGSSFSLTSPACDDFNVGNGDFTFETFIYFAGYGSGGSQVIYEVTTSGGMAIYTNDGGGVRLDAYGVGNQATWAWSPALSTWYHIAVVRSGTSVNFYVDGNKQGSTGSTSYTFVAGPIGIGGRGVTYCFNGNFDEMRMTKGVARYSGTTFAAPTAQFPDINSPSTAGKGGMVWIKNRVGVYHHSLFDTVRGIGNYIYSSAANVQAYAATGLTSFGPNGFTLGDSDQNWNNNAATYSSWTFRKAQKFFDVVQYTGNGTTQTINHSLGVAPGMILVKCINGTANSWSVYHRATSGSPQADYMYLNATSGVANSTVMWNNTQPTATSFYVGATQSVNENGSTFIAYLFAHDSSTDGLIQCGTYSGNGATPVAVTLGWEAQFVIAKSASGTYGSGGNWIIYDNMRGMDYSNNNVRRLTANAATAEATGTGTEIVPTSTGFTITDTGSGLNGSATTYIWMAIRRSNKPPTSGTQVYSGGLGPSSGPYTVSSGFPVDMMMYHPRAGGDGSYLADRLRGGLRFAIQTTGLEGALAHTWDNMTGSGPGVSGNYSDFMNWMFKRAPRVFDVVMSTGTGSNRTIAHGLGIAPEMIISKTRNSSNTWVVYHSSFGTTGDYLAFNTTAAKNNDVSVFTSTVPTSSVFSVGTSAYTNENTTSLAYYLFASKIGISKVGSYTGNGGIQQIDCGFTGGARFVLIKRTDSASDWYIWDTVRGIVSATDPHLSLNTTAAEVTTDDSIDPDNSGFIVNQVSPTNINVTSATYIYLAFA